MRQRESCNASAPKPGNLRNHRKFARGFFHETEAVVYDTDAAKGMARMLDRGELPWPERRVRRQRQVACWYDRMCLKTTRTPSENVAVIQAHLDLNQVGKVVL